MKTFKPFSVRTYQWATFMFLAAIIIGSLVGILMPAGLGWDFANFYDTGKRVASGHQEDMYHPERLMDGVAPQGGLAFWGAPLSSWFYVPLSGFSPEIALIIFKVQNTFAYYFALGLLFFLNRRFVENSSIAQWRYAAQYFGLCLLFQPLWTVYRVGGQTTPTVLLLISLGLLFHLKGKQFATALCMVVAVMIKPAFVIGVGLLVLVSGWQFFFVSTSVFFGAGVLSLALMGWELHYEFLTKMIAGAKITYPWIYNSSLYVLVEHLRLFNEASLNSWISGRVFSGLFLCIKVSVVGAFIFLMMRGKEKVLGERATRHFKFLMAFTFALMVAQTVWEHYLALLMVLLTYVLTMYPEMPRRAKALFLSVVVFSIGQNLIFIHLLESLFDFSGIGAVAAACVFKSLPLLLTLILLLLHYEELLKSYSSSQWMSEEESTLGWSGCKNHRSMNALKPI